jgi:hypothetical protein
MCQLVISLCRAHVRFRVTYTADCITNVWLIGWLMEWRVDVLVFWFVDCLTNWLSGRMFRSFDLLTIWDTKYQLSLTVVHFFFPTLKIQATISFETISNFYPLHDITRNYFLHDLIPYSSFQTMFSERCTVLCTYRVYSVYHYSTRGLLDCNGLFSRLCNSV